MTTLRLTIDIDLDDSADPQTITDQAAGRIWSLKGVKQGGNAVRVVEFDQMVPDGAVIRNGVLLSDEEAAKWQACFDKRVREQGYEGHLTRAYKASRNAESAYSMGFENATFTTRRTW